MEWLLIFIKNINIIMLLINEIFYSLQGEGHDIGIPTIFIRLTGCNLRCKYCDTEYAFYEGIEMEIEEIFRKINKWKCKRVCITGGEPLLQNEVYNLIDSLLEKNYEVSVETNGSINIGKLTKRNIIVKMDFKLPYSNMHKKMLIENLNLLRKNDELKFVVGNEIDYEFAKKIMERYKPICNIVMQPVWKIMSAKKLAELILRDELNVRFSIQLHKILWGKLKGK